MKVVFIEAVQNFGGARKSTVELAERLSKRGVRVKIVDFWGSCLPFVNAVKEKNLELEILDPRNSPIILSDSNRIKMVINIISYFLKWLKYRQKLKIILDLYEPNLVIVNNTKTISIIKKSKKFKIAFFARGWFLPKTINILNRKLLKLQSDIYIAVSQSTRQAIYAGGYATMSNIFVVPNAISEHKAIVSDASWVNWGDGQIQRPFVIMHSGGFLESKGQHITIEIAKELKRRQKNFKIILTGIIYQGQESRKYYDKIIGLIEENDLVDNFEIVLGKSDVSEYFNRIDVLIHPSSTEGLPRVVMEAMSCGKPVVGNAVGGMTDYILHGFTGFLTNFNNTEEYVRYCLELEREKDIYKYMSENARNLVKDCYTVDNQLDHFFNINF